MVSLAADGERYLEGQLTAIRGHDAVVQLNAAHTTGGRSGSWLRLTREDHGLRWRDPVDLAEIRLYRHSPRLRLPWGNHHLGRTGTLRRRGSGSPSRERAPRNP